MGHALCLPTLQGCIFSTVTQYFPLLKIAMFEYSSPIFKNLPVGSPKESTTLRPPLEWDHPLRITLLKITHITWKVLAITQTIDSIIWHLEKSRTPYPIPAKWRVKIFVFKAEIFCFEDKNFDSSFRWYSIRD